MNPRDSHRRIDLRSLAMHRLIAEKLREDPSVLDVARANLDRWDATSGNSRPYFQRWREILARPADEIAELIVRDDEQMTAMRQTSPFAGVLTPKERWRIYDAFSIGTYHKSRGDDCR